MIIKSDTIHTETFHYPRGLCLFLLLVTVNIKGNFYFYSDFKLRSKQLHETNIGLIMMAELM